MTNGIGSSTTHSAVPEGFPSFQEVLDLYPSNAKARSHVAFNVGNWKCIHGGHAIAQASHLDFDPVNDYWFMTERRVLVAYFAKRFKDAYFPAAALRTLAHRVFLHFDRARQDGRLGDPAPADPESGLWPDFLETMRPVVAELPELPSYEILRRNWGARLKRPSLQEDLSEFLQAAKEVEQLSEVEPSFYLRIPWFPYLGLDSQDALYARQRFFFGFYHVFASTNSYMHGGSMSFAPVLQNNPTGYLMDFVNRWFHGESPQYTGFEVEGKHEKKDRSQHAPIVELFGFLNLHRIPIYNSAAASTYDLFARPEDPGPYDRLFRIGALTREFLGRRQDLVPGLAEKFHELLEAPLEALLLTMEGVSRKALAEREPKEAAGLAGNRLREETQRTAILNGKTLSQSDAAMTMLHLMLDAAVFQRQRAQTPAAPLAGVVRDLPIEVSESSETLSLPESLRSLADDALGYLKSGNHVLFAGPPGTGKTTLAQLVGHAWNQNLDRVADEIDLDTAPITTVGNSAWAPFHTIGGILPDENARFKSHRGIFIDPAYEDQDGWQLRPACIVLDEMNRADLDRCIGELYPLLSRSVKQVFPAGIPGVRRIKDHPRFRVIATVNDATLDDVVFPISEGLARRFVRLELLGARVAELRQYFEDAEGDAERLEVANLVVTELFEACVQGERLTSSELGEHMPFGVGYFKNLRAWVGGSLKLSPDFGERDLRDQALTVLRTSLISGARLRGLDRILMKLQPEEPTR